MATNASERRKGYSSPAIVARRKRILDITRALIAEKGYAQFSVGEVGQRAGVAKQTIYNIFGTRERIIATAINDYFEERESAYRYASQPATMERMIERQVVASRASASMPHYLGAMMAIYFALDTDPEIWNALHKVATYPHRGWIESLAEQGALQAWVDPVTLSDDLAAHSNQALLDWCRGQVDTESSIRRKVFGALTYVAGAATEPVRTQILDKLGELARDGLPAYRAEPATLASVEPAPSPRG